jgi:hypothetical protein
VSTFHACSWRATSSSTTPDAPVAVVLARAFLVERVEPLEVDLERASPLELDDPLEVVRDRLSCTVYSYSSSSVESSSDPSPSCGCL